MVPRIASRRGRIGPLAGNLLLSAATVMVVLGTLEAFARLLEGRQPASGTPRPGREWDTVTPSFYVMTSRSPGWPPWQEFNRDGLRDRAHPPDKTPGTRRIVVLGDSVTTGPDGHPDQAYPQVLQAILDGRGPGAEVFNVALWGWATRQERTAYDRLARPYRPDRVVLGVCLNDILDPKD